MGINKRIFHVRKDIAMTPVEEGECRRDRWWLVHPEKGIAFGISYSNSDKIGEPVWLCHKEKNEIQMVVGHFFSNDDYKGHRFENIDAVYLHQAEKELKKMQVADLAIEVCAWQVVLDGQNEAEKDDSYRMAWLDAMCRYDSDTAEDLLNKRIAQIEARIGMPTSDEVALLEARQVWKAAKKA